MFKCCQSRDSFDHGWRPIALAILWTIIAALVAMTISWSMGEPRSEISEIGAAVLGTVFAPAWIGFALRGRSRSSDPSCDRD